ncbi:DNA-directed RNA polymerase III subunit RPC10, partial [Perkinsus olseni]
VNMTVPSSLQKTSEAPLSKAPSKQALRSKYREIRDYLQTITFGDSPVTVQEAGFHSRQLDPRSAKTTTRVLEEVLSKRKAEQEKTSGAKKNTKKKKASNRRDANRGRAMFPVEPKVTRPVSGAELREKLHAKIEALREARESQKEWKKAAKENEEVASSLIRSF